MKDSLRPETVELLKDKRGKFHDIGTFHKDFMEMTTNKTKTDTWNYIHLKSFYTVKMTTSV